MTTVLLLLLPAEEQDDAMIESRQTMSAAHECI
jgi:hypothetical protein